MQQNLLSAEQFSELVRLVYDCAVEPAGWTDVLRRLVEATSCAAASITITALDGSETRIPFTHGLAPDFLHSFKPDYSLDAARYFRSALDRPGIDLDAPFVLSRLMPPETIAAMRVTREWAAPQGFVDNMSAVVQVTPSRVASVDLMFRAEHGSMPDASVEILRLLVPHLRRAIIISDLLDMEGLRVDAFRASLDGLSFGTLIVAADGRIIEANSAARLLLERRTPIRELQGRLAGDTSAITRHLRRAIESMIRDEATCREQSIGVDLRGEGASVVLAHVLPLANGTARKRLAPDAVAAVFVAGAGIAPPAAVAAVADAYGMTEAERRMLAEVAGGAGVAEASAALGCKLATGRTHMKHIFAKLGVHRHSELVALIGRLTPPVVDDGT